MQAHAHSMLKRAHNDPKPLLPRTRPYESITPSCGPNTRTTTRWAARTRCLALHDVGLTAEGVAFMEADSHRGKEVVEGTGQEDVLQRVLYPQVHVNGIKKKKKRDHKKHKRDVNISSLGGHR